MANPTTPRDPLELERELDRAEARLKDFAGIAIISPNERKSPRHTGDRLFL